MKVSNSKDSVELHSVNRANKSKRTEAIADKNKPAEASETSGGKPAANVELSSDAKILSRGIDAAKDVDLTDKDKIEMIKAKIKDGKYNPDYGKVADKMLNEHILSN